jgi:hypothetical protein
MEDIASEVRWLQFRVFLTLWGSFKTSGSSWWGFVKCSLILMRHMKHVSIVDWFDKTHR